MLEFENLGEVNKTFFEEFRTVFSNVLSSGRYILGKHVEEFQDRFAAYCGTPYSVGVASGLDALVISIRALEIPPGSKILVPSNTFIASVLAVVNAGCVPVLVEPDIKTYNIDPANIEQNIAPDVKAVMAVHLYGKVCDMKRIDALCKKHDLKLIEDASQAHGATYKGVKAGAFGDAAAFSFYPTKNLGALGDAGGITMREEAARKQAEKLRNYGSAVKYYNESLGYNSRLDEMQAAFLSVKLNRLDEINAHKRKLAAIYLAHLKQDFILPVVEEDYFDVYHIFNIRHPRRDQLRAHLLKNNIGTEIHYPIPPHRQAGYKGFFEHMHYPVADEIHSTTLSLPISFAHREEDIYQVVEVLNRF